MKIKTSRTKFEAQLRHCKCETYKFGRDSVDYERYKKADNESCQTDAIAASNFNVEVESSQWNKHYLHG